MNTWQPYSTYARAFRIPFQLLYSHLNPLLYLLVLKKFQQHHLRVFRWILRQLFLEKKAEPASPISTFQKLLFHVAMLTRIVKTFLASGTLVFTGIVLLSSLYSSVTQSTHIIQTYEESGNYFSKVMLSAKAYNVKDLGSFVESQTSSNLNIQSHCVDIGGTLSMVYRRCFILATHNPIYLNFTEHRKYCEKGNMTMCYPRSQDEMIFMWDLLKSWSFLNFEPRIPWLYWYVIPNPGEANASQLFPLKYALERYKIHVGFVKDNDDTFTRDIERFSVF